MDFRDEIFRAIRDFMRADKNIITITNDMNAMVLDEIREEMPDRVINIGIAEQNMMGVAGGLAQSGKTVFTFGIGAHVTTRAWEQIKLDICCLDLPVIIIGVGPGLGYGPDGPTHHAVEDLTLMSILPNMAIYNPCDPVNTAHAVQLAVARRRPAYIRLDRAAVTPLYAPDDDVSQGMKTQHDGSDVVIFSSGTLTYQALDAAKHLEASGVSTKIVDVFQVKPLNEEALLEAVDGIGTIVSVEEHNATLGFGSLIATTLLKNGVSKNIHIHGLPDEFLFGSASRDWAYDKFGLNGQGICDFTKNALDRK